MIYQDRIYRENEITEPVVLEIINSKVMQRLKGVDQAGYFEPYFPGGSHSRFEHSLGVFLLLKKFQAPLEEQIAGLIHDVSHSAFSHCIDYVVSGGSGKTQSHQDNIFADYVNNSELPEIIKKHGLDLAYILDDANFPLKENDLPQICADRIDYVLRSAVAYKQYPLNEVAEIIDNLNASEGKWIFNDFNSAKKFAELFKKLNSICYSGISTALMFTSVKHYLQRALEKKYITVEDLYTTDKEALDKINQHLESDGEIKLWWERVNNLHPSKNDSADYDEHIFCKSRAVDPLCYSDGQIKKISDLDPAWKNVLEQESKPKEYFIKFM